MDQTKAAQISQLLVQQGLEHRLIKQGTEWAFVVQKDTGIDATVLKNVADNQQVTVKARLVIIS